MGSNPKDSVVNELEQLHDVSNVFVVDAGPFVSQADKNPTWTILALAMRSSEKIIEEFKKLMPISFPIYVDMELELNWGVPGLPTTFLLNPEGKLIYRAVGKREFASEAMINFLTKEINKFDFTQHQPTKYSLKNK
jgi:hypothetical protein